jgi:anti-sigma factor RsiW
MRRQTINSCPVFEELSALIDGDLSPARELQVRWHVDICATCARYADVVVALKRAVGRAHERDIPLPALRRSVRARWPRRRGGWQWRAGAIAAPLLVAASMVLCCVEASGACETSRHRAPERAGAIVHRLHIEERLPATKSS